MKFVNRLNLHKFLIQLQLVFLNYLYSYLILYTSVKGFLTGTIEDISLIVLMGEIFLYQCNYQSESTLQVRYLRLLTNAVNYCT